MDKLKQSEPSKAVGIFIYIALILLSFATSFYMLWTESPNFNQTVFGIKAITIHQDKVQIIRKSLLYLSSFLFLMTLLTMSSRVFTKSQNPLLGRDAYVVTIFNQIIRNTLEQSIVFFGLFISALFAQGQVQNGRLVTLCGLFFLGRITFAIGYILTIMTEFPTWRAYGFSMNLTIICILLSICFDFSFIETD